MRICLITPRPGHPLLAATTALLRADHEVETIDPGASDDDRTRAPSRAASAGARPPGDARPPADVYLLKARTPRALALARTLEAQGAPVLNSASATALCQDRTAMADLARGAGLPFAHTRAPARLGRLAEEAERLAYPLVVKSRYSRRGDLVARVDDASQLRALEARWAQEPVVVQEFTANSGWDHKLWVIAGQVFGALRRSELADGSAGPSLPLPLDRLPPGRLDLVRRVGGVFSLDVYGVDLIDTEDGSPLIVDVNAFPGIRGQDGAPEALAALALRTARGVGTTG